MEQGWDSERWAMVYYLLVLFLVGFFTRFWLGHALSWGTLWSYIFDIWVSWVNMCMHITPLLQGRICMFFNVSLVRIIRSDERFRLGYEIFILTLAGVFHSIWQIRSLDMLRNRFTFLPEAFTKRLQAHPHKWIYFTWKCVKFLREIRYECSI